MDREEPPKRTRGDEDDHSALLSTYHHDMGKVSEHVKDVFSGMGLPDMSGSAWLAIKTKTQKSESTVDEKYVEHSQKDVDK